MELIPDDLLSLLLLPLEKRKNHPFFERGQGGESLLRIIDDHTGTSLYLAI